MRTLQVLIATLTLVAVAANPVVASLVPCCCVTHGKSERSCCRTASKVVTPTVALPTCCVEEHASAALLAHHDCCCCRAPAAVPASSAQPKQIVEQPSIESRCSSIAVLAFAPTTHRFERISGRLTLTGPPLLALYCIWLK